MWAVAERQKEDREARYLCRISMVLDWTTTSLAIVVLRFLTGEISQHGVSPTEACIDLNSFLDEASKYLPENHQGKPLLNKRFDWLE